MNTLGYKTKRKGQPKRISPISKAKTAMVTEGKNWKPNATVKLTQIYNTKTEWATKRMPKLQEK
jgi:hypothetical protein